MFIRTVQLLMRKVIVSGDQPTSKKRSQFRVASKNITALYETVELVEV